MEPWILEWTTSINGDDPKRFSIEDVKAGKYNKSWWKILKSRLFGKNNA